MPESGAPPPRPGWAAQPGGPGALAAQPGRPGALGSLPGGPGALAAQPGGPGALGFLPASGAWRPGDPAGDRRFVELFADQPLALEAGGSFGPIIVAYETWGTPTPDRANGVLVCHALTGDSHLHGPVGAGHPTRGWWDGIVAPGAALDAADWWVVCPNVLGGCQGSTGPASADPDGRPWGSRFPTVTIRDQVAVEAAFADAVGVDRWAAVVGGSMGGMRVIEWAVAHPDRLARAVVVATTAAASAEQIALSSIQEQAIRLDPGWAGGDYYDAPPGHGPAAGLALARRLGHLSYRAEPELAARFDRRPQGSGPGGASPPWEDPLAGGRYAVEGYLDHQAAKLAARFDANSYLVLSRAMDDHDVGRGRGGVAAALARVTASVTVAGVDTDRLYPLRLQEEIAQLVPGRPPVRVVASGAGHDGFLVEAGQIDKIIADAMG